MQPSSNIKGSLAEHRRAVHEGVKYPCMQCKKQFSWKESLAEHARSVHEGVKYPCIQCKKQFSWKESLANHLKTVHRDVKYHCSQCDHQATTKVNLASHRREIHEGVFLVDNVKNNFQRGIIRFNTKGQYMKGSNTRADNATIKQLLRQV